MPLSETLRLKHSARWDRVFAHPFVRGIGDGTLPAERFRFYLAQDYLFLIEYARVIALGVAKSPDLATMARLASLLESTLNGEMEMHRAYSASFGVSPEDLERAVASPTTRAYTSYLLSLAYSGSLAEILFALLPCACGYAEVGRRLQATSGLRVDNPYVEWIRTYASPEYEALAEWLRDLADRLADGLPAWLVDRLAALYAGGVDHELAFWQASWQVPGPKPGE